MLCQAKESLPDTAIEAEDSCSSPYETGGNDQVSGRHGIWFLNRSVFEYPDNLSASGKLCLMISAAAAEGSEKCFEVRNKKQQKIWARSADCEKFPALIFALSICSPAGAVLLAGPECVGR